MPGAKGKTRMNARAHGRWLRPLVSFLLVACVGVAHGWTNPEDDYRKLIRVNEDIQPLGEHPFGENISLYDGSLSFSQTDISLPGNGPALQLIRHFEVYGNIPKDGPAEPAFADWELDVPRLQTLTIGWPGQTAMWTDNQVTGSPEAIQGWETDNTLSSTIDKNARCSNFTAPPEVFNNLSDPSLPAWDPVDWWRGYRLMMPGDSPQDVLVNDDAGTKGTYPAVTKAHWRFSCLSSTANGQPGEGFLGHAPDGTLYWFDFLVYRQLDQMSKPAGSNTVDVRLRKPLIDRIINSTVVNLVSLLSGSSDAHATSTTSVLSRSVGVLLVTKVQDRFGNTLNYSYDANGYLTGITASDGRALSITYVANTTRIQSVTLQPASGQPRTWNYTYSSDGLSLTSVRLPDGTSWNYNLGALHSNILVTSVGNSCTDIAVPSNLGPVSGSITHPAGLTGTFTLTGTRHGRSFVPYWCVDANTTNAHVEIPRAWYSLSVSQVTFTGAGMPSRTWSYSYSPTNESWNTCTGSCPTTIWTDMQAPDGSTTRTTFSNRYNSTESQLVSTQYYSGAIGSSTLLRQEDSYYADPTTSPLPAQAGTMPLGNINQQQATTYSPLNQKVTTQDGDTYTWQAESFNSYAQVTQQKRYSSIAGEPTLEESLGYLNDTNLWVLGLPTTVTNVATGEVESQNVYDTTHDTLSQRWRFGQQLMSYTFDSAGNLASFTDGNNHTTTLGSYKRGIPQAIGYPDNTSESLVVDDFGQITSLTDQAGKITSYAYDGVGRLTRITYPTGDSVAWAPKVFTYDYVTGAERGIAANHWRRTVSHGNARSVTYFDAELRPVLSDTYISTDGNSHITARTDYDWRGQKTFVSYPQAGALNLADLTTGTTTQYDALGRATQTQQTSELGTLTSSTAYLSGARVQVTDPKGKVTTTTYQVFDQPSYDNAILVQAPDGISQAIARDVYGNPLSIRQYGSYNGLTSDLTKYLYYDNYHRLCRTAEPESGSTVMAYDAANNVAWTADGLSISGTACSQSSVADAAKTTRTYDAMNRVLTLVPPAGTQSTQYTYDARGNVQTAVSGVSTWSSTRNGLGLLTGETLQITGQNAWTLGYGYDANGSLSSITYPDDSVVAYAPDALGRPTQAGSYATGVSYFPNGEVSAFTFGNGALYAAQQNARQLLSNFSYALGSTLNVSEDYSYDANANITQVNDLTGGPRAKSFSYDDLNRLTSATATNLWGTESYTYDPLNNIASRTGGSTTVTYSYDATNRLTGLSDGTTFGYDNRGNVTSKNGVALTFDAKNQLQNVGGSVAYAYDASGRRVSKTPTSGGATYYFYSQAGQLMYQWDAASATSTDFVYLGKKLLAKNAYAGAANGGSAVAPGLYPPSSSNTGTYSISWYGVQGATSYELQELVSGSWQTIYSGTATTLGVANQADGIHQYRVRSCASSTCGSWSASASVDVNKQSAPVAPDLSPQLAVQRTSVPTTYTVYWSGVPDAATYSLREQFNGGAWTVVYTGSAGSWDVTAKPSGSYVYQVQACNSGGCGPWSDVEPVDVVVDITPIINLILD